MLKERAKVTSNVYGVVLSIVNKKVVGVITTKQLAQT
jgi:hypothetical protein